MRKTLFIVLILNALLEGLTALRLILLPVQLEDFDAAVQGGYVLYGFAALSIAMSIIWFNKYGDKEISLAMGLAVLNISYFLNYRQYYFICCSRHHRTWITFHSVFISIH